MDLATFPTTFFVETVMACNLKCPECAIGGEITARPKSIMRYDDFLIISDKIRPYAKYVLLHMWGEPLMNNDIFRMIENVSSYASVNISTNALLLDVAKAECLINSGVSDLIVSIDGVSQPVYSLYRVGGIASRALNNLKLLSRINQRYGRRVNITPQMIVFDHNYHEIQTFEAICLELGLTPSYKAPYIRNKNSKFKASADPKYQRSTYSNRDDLIQAVSTCSDPRNVFTVTVTGDVVLCCHDYDAEIKFGNILEKNSTVPIIWLSENCMKIRSDIISGNPCNFCTSKCMSYVLTDDYPIGTTFSSRA